MATDLEILSSLNQADQCENNARFVDSEPSRLVLFLLHLSSVLMYLFLFKSQLFVSSKYSMSSVGLLVLVLRLVFFVDRNNDLIFSALLSLFLIRMILTSADILFNVTAVVWKAIGISSGFKLFPNESDDLFFTQYDVPHNASCAVSTLLSICNMKEEDGYTETYATKLWRRVAADPKTCTWVSKAPSDGILFHTSSTFEATPDEVLMWISEEHSPSGLEHISFRYENLFVSKNNNIFVKNFFVESGSMQASNRIVTVVSGIVSREDGSIVLHSRSSNVPERIELKTREPCESNGYIRGVLYASGFIIKPLESATGSSKPLTSVQFAIHLDLLGSVTGRANRYNREVLLQSTQTLFRNLRSHCADRDRVILSSAIKKKQLISSGDDTSSTPSTPRRSQSPRSKLPVVMSLPVHISIVEPRVTHLAEKRLRAAHALLLELRAEQKVGVGVYYPAPTVAPPGAAAEAKVTPKKTWRAVSARKALLSGADVHPRSRSTSPQATPVRSSTTVASEPVELLLHRSSIKIWSHKRQGVLSAVMHLEASSDVVKAAILSGSYGLDSLLIYSLKLLDINTTHQAQLSWRAYHGPAPLGDRDAYILTSEEPLGPPSTSMLASSGHQLTQSSSQDILYQALGKPSRPSETSTSTVSSVSSFLRRTPPPAPLPSPTPIKTESTKDDGFAMAWTSFDEVCDNIMELRHAVERTVPGHPIQLSDYNRMSMRVGGWLCEPTPAGGCEVSLFVDTNIWDDLSHWMTTVLAQSIMVETMEDLRANVVALVPAPAHSPNGKSSQHSHCAPGSLYGGFRQQLKRVAAEDDQTHSYGHGPVFEHRSRQTVNSQPNLSGKSDVFSIEKGDRQMPKSLQEALKLSPHSQGEVDTTSTTSSAPSTGRQHSSSAPPEPTEVFQTPRHDQTVSPRTPRTPRSEAVMTPLRAIKQHIRSLGYADFSVESINMLFQYTDFVETTASGEPVMRPPSTLVWQVRTKRDDMTLYKTMVPGSTWQLIKCTCYMNFKKEPIQSLLSDDSRLGLYDDMFDYCTYIRRADPFTNIRRMCFKPVWPTSPRDFVVSTTTYHMADGSALLATRSLVGELDEQAGYVRGRLHISGFLIVPCCRLPEDPMANTVPDGCRVTLVVHIDLGGNLPSGPLNFFTMNAPLRLLSRVKEVLLQEQLAAETKLAD